MLIRLAKEVSLRTWREERGVSFVWLVFLIPVAVILIAFVINVANWFEHRRHLQLQVDAAALAAGGKWVFTQRSAGTTTCTDSSLENESLKYAGDLTRLNSAYNEQVSNKTNVHVLFNSPSYWATAADSSLENTDTAGPCTTGYLDVKATDDKPPVVFGASVAGITPSIHAHARIDFFVADFLSGAQLLPVALPDPTPKRAYAYFVNESTGAPLNDSSGNPLPAVPLYYTGLSQNGVDYWDSLDRSQSPAAYHFDTIPSMPAGNVGVRIALSGSLTNSQCGQPLVSCYDTTSGNTAPNGTTPLYGIDNIRTFDASATPGTGSALAALTVYGAKLTTADCTNPYFPTATCSVRLHIRAKFAPGITVTGNPKLTMVARVDGATQNSQQFAMAPGSSSDCPAANPAGSLCWESTADIPVPAGGGWHTIDVAWADTETTDNLGGTACKNGGSNPCDDTAGPGATAQRVFVGNATTAGPVQLVDLLDNSSPTPIRAEQTGSAAFHSYAQGTANVQLGVQIGIQQAFATAPPNAPPVTLRFGSGGQTQAVDCNPSTGPYVNGYQAKYGNSQYNAMTSLQGELASGCVPTYQKWDGASQCPGAATGTPYPGNRGQLWSSTQPWFCAAATTGNINSAIGPGLNTRILGNASANTCPPAGAPGHNNWNPSGDPNWDPANPTTGLKSNDPRIVFVFLTPFGTFNGSGSDTYPVIRFATFYITGWQSNGAGNNNPCQGNGDDPAPSAGVVGHFMTYAAQDIGGSTTGTHCTDPNGIDVCIAVLTQ